jgi:hypothetical protein
MPSRTQKDRKRGRHRSLGDSSAVNILLARRDFGMAFRATGVRAIHVAPRVDGLLMVPLCGRHECLFLGYPHIHDENTCR